MDYKPRFYQPFSLEEAVRMDVSVLTEEISRLQNSIEHLKTTQEELKEAMSSTPDPEFTKAVEENEVVIGSQEERISILRVALTEKGVLSSSHYNPVVTTGHAVNGHTSQQTGPDHTNNTAQAAASLSSQTDPHSDDGGGIHL
ncbi:hypothetical protein BKA93DRAFT_758315 [Sparassis latifolia]|uniref:Uncharacterized protein n=1 Tax=Sparassis crispa TaxID=139825 RepID=A0A401GBY9_9APHY|nr:hypothetical protein SCP_0208980 [Sparassis crispa]GBE79698.1 hypothetical protein SCP_0208980 [Sparassis crispa]